MQAFKTMTKYAFRHRLLWLAGIFVPAVFSAATNIYFANILQDYVDQMSGNGSSFQSIAGMLLGALAVLLLLSCVDDAGLLASSLLPAMMEAELRADYCGKLICTSLKNLEKFRTGELLTRYTTDAELCTKIAVNDISGVAYPLIVGTGYAAAVLSSDLRMGLIMLVLGISVILLNFIFVPKMRYAQKDILEAKEAYISEYSNAIQGKMSIRQYSAREIMGRRIREAAGLACEKECRAVRLRTLKALTSDALAGSCIYLLTPLACVFAAYGYVEISLVLFINQLCKCFITYTQNFAAAFVNYNEHKLSFERISEVLVLLEESEEQEGARLNKLKEQEKSGPKEARAQKEAGTKASLAQKEVGTGNTCEQGGGRVIFDHVSVSYGDHQVLKEISFTASPGECVCICGGSGSGKSTLIKALMQMADYQGEISIGGKNCKELSLDALRRQIAFSPEHSDLFGTSVYENIQFGNPAASEEKVYRAADRAAVAAPETFLRREAGENGELLSGGQRQRVSIARALLRDAPIVILDEPTAALDTESEAEILQTISDLKQEGKCILLITHKKSTMRIADRILEL